MAGGPPAGSCASPAGRTGTSARRRAINRRGAGPGSPRAVQARPTGPRGRVRRAPRSGRGRCRMGSALLPGQGWCSKPGKPGHQPQEGDAKPARLRRLPSVRTCFQVRLSSGGRIRTCDLWVMSPASYRAAPPRVGRTTLPAAAEAEDAGRRTLPTGRQPPGVAPAACLRRLVGRRPPPAGPPAPGPAPRSRRRAAPSPGRRAPRLMSATACVQRPASPASPPPSGGVVGVGRLAGSAVGVGVRRPSVGRRARRCRSADSPAPGTEHLVQGLGEGVGVADPVAVVDQHLLQQREGVLPRALARRAVRRRAGRPRRSAASAGCRTPRRESWLLNSVRSGRDLVVRDERLLHLPRPAERRVAGQSQHLDLRRRSSGSLDAEMNADRFSRSNAFSALVSWKVASSSPGRWARM